MILQLMEQPQARETYNTLWLGIDSTENWPFIIAVPCDSLDWAYLADISISILRDCLHATKTVYKYLTLKITL